MSQRYNASWGPKKSTTPNRAASSGQQRAEPNLQSSANNPQANVPSAVLPAIAPAPAARQSTLPLRTPSPAPGSRSGPSNAVSSGSQSHAPTAPGQSKQSGKVPPTSAQKNPTSTESTTVTVPQRNTPLNPLQTNATFNVVQGSSAAPLEKFLFANHFQIGLGRYEQVYSYPLKIELIPKKKKGKQDQSNADGGSGNENDEQESEHEDYSSESDDEASTSDLAPANPQDPKKSEVAKPKKKRLIYLLLEKLRQLGRLPSPIATDYLDELITADKLDERITSRRFHFKYHDEYSQGPAQDCRRYRVTFGPPNLISLVDLFAHYQRLVLPQTTNHQLSDEAITDAVNALNVIFSYRPYQNCFSGAPGNVPAMTTVKGQRFYGIAQFPAPHDRHESWSTLTGDVLARDGGLLMIPGFIRSVRPTYSGPGYVDLNIYTKTGSFWRHGTVQELIVSWRAGHRNGSWPELQDFLYGAPVKMRSRERNLDPFFGIKGLLMAGGQAATADLCDMEHPKRQYQMRVRQYYATNHGWQMNRNVYIVKVGQGKADNRLTIPADLLDIIPGKIKPDVIPKMGARLPEFNHAMIVGDGRNTFFAPGATQLGAGAFALTLSPQMAKVPVTILGRPRLKYNARSGPGQPIRPLFINEKKLKKGQWDIKEASFLRPATKKKWTCVELVPSHAQVTCTPTGIEHFAFNLEEALKDCGMADFEYVEIVPGDTSQQQQSHQGFLPKSKTVGSLNLQYEAVKDLFRLLRTRGVQLAVLLLPSQDQDLYSAIKRVGDQVQGISTICHVLKFRQLQDRK